MALHPAVNVSRRHHSTAADHGAGATAINDLRQIVRRLSPSMRQFQQVLIEPTRPVRIDKWLWAVRLYKTRSQAADACRSGHVRLSGQPVKPSRFVRPGDTITAVTGEITKTVKVLVALETRVGARLVKDYAEDLTPPAEYLKPREKALAPFGFRPKGAGRPTKKDRRNMEGFVL
ncbi:MAG: RNA-binding S4 domain-containing protein [Verrucomicrobiota bacterium]